MATLRKSNTQVNTLNEVLQISEICAIFKAASGAEKPSLHDQDLLIIQNDTTHGDCHDRNNHHRFPDQGSDSAKHLSGLSSCFTVNT